MSLRADKASVEKRFDARFVGEEDFGPVYVQNAFEFPRWPVIAAEAPNEIRLARWGLVPTWIREEEEASRFRVNTVNARAETIREKPAFRKAAVTGHCLVLADGFFEFREVGGKKYPYYIQVDGGKPFAMAGLIEWRKPAGGQLAIPGFSIITTEANPLMEKIHNRKKRMPVILESGDERKWILQQGGYETLRPFPEERMEAWTVSGRLTDRGRERNVPEAVEPHAYPGLEGNGGGQGSLF